VSALRFFAIILIFIAATIAWMVLGGTLEYRTSDLGESLTKEVNSRWGPSGLVQAAPYQTGSAAAIDPAKSEIKVHFDHADRYMGLLWFSTYTVEFSGAYTVATQRAGQNAASNFVFELPKNATTTENLNVTLDGQARDIASVKEEDKLVVAIPADEKSHVVTVSYRTQGRDRWLYDLARDREHKPTVSRGGREDSEALVGAGHTAMVKDFTLTATTNFRDIDYPKGCASPTPEPAVDIEGGKKATWHFENRSTRQEIGVEMPARLNAGPVASRMSFFAPVSLFFFFTVLFTIMVLKKTPLHPMHYLFISAGFFAFHILLAYLVDLVQLNAAFWISAVVSVFLVVSYMRLVAGLRFAVVYVGAAQLVYLIGFSYAFMWKGYTGLTVVIGAIVTLFVLMQATGRVNWNEAFARTPANAPPSPLPPTPPKS
jgi:hypothetical protein